MILRYKTCYGGKSQILLPDVHGEYTGDFEKDYISKLVWNNFEIEELSQKLGGLKKGKSLMERTFPELPKNHPWDGSNLWLLEGSQEDLMERFNNLAEGLEGVPSGDDDVFDYWPNTMDMLEIFAKDLKDLDWDPEGAAQKRVIEVYEKVKSDGKWKEYNIDFDAEVWKPSLLIN